MWVSTGLYIFHAGFLALTKPHEGFGRELPSTLCELDYPSSQEGGRGDGWRRGPGRRPLNNKGAPLPSLL